MPAEIATRTGASSDRTTVDLDQLQNRLAAIVRQNENQPVRIRGDGKVAYQRIVEVIDTCQKAGIWNISFATQRPEPAN